MTPWHLHAFGVAKFRMEQLHGAVTLTRRAKEDSMRHGQYMPRASPPQCGFRVLSCSRRVPTKVCRKARGKWRLQKALPEHVELVASCSCEWLILDAVQAAEVVGYHRREQSTMANWYARWRASVQDVPFQKGNDMTCKEWKFIHFWHPCRMPVRSSYNPTCSRLQALLMIWLSK